MYTMIQVILYSDLCMISTPQEERKKVTPSQILDIQKFKGVFSVHDMVNQCTYKNK